MKLINHSVSQFTPSGFKVAADWLFSTAVVTEGPATFLLHVRAYRP